MPPPRGRLPESVPTPTDVPEPMISACYIVRNAQDTLEESILSVAPHVSEIVVTDTGSTDQTLAILQRLMAPTTGSGRVASNGAMTSPRRGTIA